MEFIKEKDVIKLLLEYSLIKKVLILEKEYTENILIYLVSGVQYDDFTSMEKLSIHVLGDLKSYLDNGEELDIGISSLKTKNKLLDSLNKNSIESTW